MPRSQKKIKLFRHFFVAINIFMCYTIHIKMKEATMGIVYQTDKRSGITYAYENQSFWDPELKRSKSKRKLIGRVDPETKEIIPTDGRCKKRSPSYEAGSDDYEMPKTMKGLKDEVRRLLKENQELREQLEKYKSK